MIKINVLGKLVNKEAGNLLKVSIYNFISSLGALNLDRTDRTSSLVFDFLTGQYATQPANIAVANSRFDRRASLNMDFTINMYGTQSIESALNNTEA